MIRQSLAALILSALSFSVPGLAIEESTLRAPEHAAQDAAGPAKSVDTAKPIASLSWLVGGVWTADATKLGPGMLRIETRYQWADNQAYIRFNTHFVFDKGAQHNYDGNFFWNPSDKTLAVWYMDAQNSITQGPVKLNDNDIIISFRGEDFEGKTADLRVIVTRKNNDNYHWALQEMKGGAWKDLAGLEYLRVAGS
jgi:hypothetical protein